MDDVKQKIEALHELLDSGGKRVVLVTHTNPDGDAIGSTLACADVLEALGNSVTCIVPNRYPSFLEWMNGVGRIVVAKESLEEATKAISEAEVIFCLDMNSIDRLENLAEVIRANTVAKRILVDHHLNPPVEEYDILFSYPNESSTSFIVYQLIDEVFGIEFMTKEVAENLYAGIMTDTGNFSFSFITPALMRAVAVLVEKGVDIPKINRAVYSSYSEGRVRLLGYSLCHKMTVVADGRAAFIALSEREMRRFNFQLGDSEGFVNYPLTISGIEISAMLVETRKFIRVSLRSRGDKVDVNVFANRYFDGGGHKNASGGKSFRSLAETIEYFQKSATEFLAGLK